MFIYAGKIVDANSDEVCETVPASGLNQEEKYEIRQRVWAAKRLDNAMNGPSPEVKVRAAELYREESLSLVGDSIFLSLLGLCVAWGFGSLSTVLSYGVGTAIGTGYVVLLAQVCRFYLAVLRVSI